MRNLDKKTKAIILAVAVLTLLAAAAVLLAGGKQPQEAEETPSPEPAYVTGGDARPAPPAPPSAPVSGIEPPSAFGP